jgi:hypothetical protein
MRVLISLGVSCAEWYTSGLVFDARYVDRGDIGAAHQIAGVTRTARLIEQQRRAFRLDLLRLACRVALPRAGRAGDITSVPRSAGTQAEPLWTSSPTYRVLLDSGMADLLALGCATNTGRLWPGEVTLR